MTTISNTDVSPVGSCLQHFWRDWALAGLDKRIVQILKKGYRIPFTSLPTLTAQPINFPSYSSNSNKLQLLREAVEEMLTKRAVEIIHPQNLSPGFYSRLFLVPKKNGKWRPVIDLSPLNKMVEKKKFKMETPRTVLSAIQRNQFMTSIDLTDAYFHVPIHPASRKYLRFVFGGTIYQFRSLCFGLSTAPQIFTEVMRPIGSLAHYHSVNLHLYLDDWLCNANSELEAARHTQWILETAARLGLKVNLAKSDLSPQTRLTYLGIVIDTVQFRAYASPQRVENFRKVLQPFLIEMELPVWQWLSLLGHMASLEKLVEHGRRWIRPIQLQLKENWTSPISRERSVIITPECRRALRWWTSEDRFREGTSLEPLNIDAQMFTDASKEGWGAHVDHLQASGLWNQQESLSHINLLELEAVSRGLRAFQEYLSGWTVAVMTDNTTVVSHINKQGGTKSAEMCLNTIQLLEWAEAKHIQLTSTFVPGHLNVTADLLSRRNQTLKNEWSIHTQILDQIWKQWDRPHVDLFATADNHRLPAYFSPIPDPNALGVDAFLQSWSGIEAYAYPPIAMIRSTLNKILQDRASVILIAPLWRNQEWFPDLLSLLVEKPLKLPAWKKLLRQPYRGHFHLNPEYLSLHAWKLSADPCKRKVFLRRQQRSLPELTEQAPPTSISLNGPSTWIGVSDKTLILSRPLFNE